MNPLFTTMYSTQLSVIEHKIALLVSVTNVQYKMLFTVHNGKVSLGSWATQV